MDDLRALLGLVAEERKDISTEYGLVSAQSIAAIQRSVLRLAQDGGEHFFGEPGIERLNAHAQEACLFVEMRGNDASVVLKQIFPLGIVGQPVEGILPPARVMRGPIQLLLQNIQHVLRS
ncbi:hypothetical protein G6F22_020064 [Rhizopus arrhizus]|nr:hypothetical protein G6F22_020064 [Rhizopus arrhizus]